MISGWGYELTMRVRAQDEDQSPAWPFELLEKVARYTQDNAHPFEVGDRLDPGGPITGRDDTRLVAVAFALDPEVPATDSPNGRLEFRQLVGITRDELDEMKATNTARIIARFQLTNPLLITDPNR
jgi:suppressor of fused